MAAAGGGQGEGASGIMQSLLLSLLLPLLLVRHKESGRKMSSGRQNCQTKESTIDVAAAQQQRETSSEATEREMKGRR